MRPRTEVLKVRLLILIDRENPLFKQALQSLDKEDYTKLSPTQKVGGQQNKTQCRSQVCAISRKIQELAKLVDEMRTKM